MGACTTKYKLLSCFVVFSLGLVIPHGASLHARLAAHRVETHANAVRPRRIREAPAPADLAPWSARQAVVYTKQQLPFIWDFVVDVDCVDDEDTTLMMMLELPVCVVKIGN